MGTLSHPEALGCSAHLETSVCCCRGISGNLLGSGTQFPHEANLTVWAVGSSKAWSLGWQAGGGDRVGVPPH